LATIPIWGGGISPILWMVAKFTVAGFDAPVGTKTCFIRMPPGLVCVSALDCLNWDCYIVMILYCSQGTFRGKGRAYVDRLEALPAGVTPLWQRGMQVVKC
jgi:hypothetical protein